ncbi:hypothetical protein [Pseudomonas sp.]|uniref:terminase small subunit-like protein n=1 Tax=Pseudomonas sp. TaxID=306 RepID=UPI003CC66DA7
MAKTPPSGKAASSKKKPPAAGRAGAKPRVRKKGRPSAYTNALALSICTGIAEGLSLRSICKSETMPALGTVMRWLADDSNAEFREQYARAREAQADKLAEEILQIADDGSNDNYQDEDGNSFIDHDHIARSRLRVDARKWLASKMAPKRYGDKVTQEHTGANGGAIEVHSRVTFVRPPERKDDEE